MNERNKINIWLRLNGSFRHNDGLSQMECCDCAESLRAVDKRGNQAAGAWLSRGAGRAMTPGVPECMTTR